MDRRTVLTSLLAIIGSIVPGCLENRGLIDDSDNSEGSTDPTRTNTTAPENGDGSDGGTEFTDPGDDDPSNETETDEQSIICAIRFELLNEWSDREESASVAFDEDAVTVTGIILGRNGCYTARLDEAVIEDRQLIVSIESYEDVEENEGCTSALIFIEYQTIVKIDGPRPATVRVEHNGKHVTTEQPS